MQRHGALLAFAILAAAGLPLLSVGCDSAADSLTNGRGTAGGSHRNSSSGSTAGDDDDSTTTGGDPAAQANAKALFDGISAQLTTQCGPCHTTGAGSAPIWLGVGDAQYATITAYKGIITADPSTSILVTKGQHEGAPLSGDLLTSVKAWLTAEAAAQSSTPAKTTTITTDPVAIPAGAGSITLPAPGGQLTFTASMAGNILSLKSVALVAPADTGVHATGIHILLVHADNSTTVDESLAGSDTTSAKGASAPVGVGLVIVPEVAATDKIALEIDSLVAATGTTTTTATGGCKNVQSFTTNAAPQMKNLCLNCHNTGGSGFGSLDMSALALATPDYAKACGQAKAKIDTTNPAQSPIITTPTGGDPAHPLKNAPQSFVTAMTTWINAEK